MKLTNNFYDIAKFVAIVGLPALTTLVGTVGAQLGYDMTAVIAIMTAIDTFLGALLGISTTSYNKAQEQSAIPATVTTSTEALDEIERTYTLDEIKEEEK